MLEQVINREPDIFGDLPKQDRRYIPALVDWDSGTAAGAVAELFVRASLPDLGKTELYENGNYFTGFQNWDAAHALGDSDVLNTDEL